MTDSSHDHSLQIKPATCDGVHGLARCRDPKCWLARSVCTWDDIDQVVADPAAFWASCSPAQALALLRAAPQLAGPWEPIPGNPRGVQRFGVGPAKPLAFAGASAETQRVRDHYDGWLRDEGYTLVDEDRPPSPQAGEHDSSCRVVTCGGCREVPNHSESPKGSPCWACKGAGAVEDTSAWSQERLLMACNACGGRGTGARV